MADKFIPAEDLIPPHPSLKALQDAAKGCKACGLWERGTRTVFGEGGSRASVMFIGEQPGNDEDRAGKPFVGPAGRILNEAMSEAGIDCSKAYVTNVVKHFKWSPRGKRRIHSKPNAVEINACRPWLKAEISLVKPAILVCLGATAAQAMLGKNFRVSRERGRFFQSEFGSVITATVHPSSVLRAPDDEMRHEANRLFIEDLKKVAQFLKSHQDFPPPVG